MDLEYQAGAEIGFLQRLVGVDHRDLDDVGRGALDRHVDRESLPWPRGGPSGESRRWPRAATKQERIGRPCSVRNGMFWRLGLVIHRA